MEEVDGKLVLRFSELPSPVHPAAKKIAKGIEEGRIIVIDDKEKTVEARRKHA